MSKTWKEQPKSKQEAPQKTLDHLRMEEARQDIREALCKGVARD